MQNNSSSYRTSLSFELLKTFTDDELNNFEKLIHSGYLNTKEELAALLDNLKMQALIHPAFTPNIQCLIYNSLYPKEQAKKALNNSQKKKLSKAMNELLDAAEKFLMFEKIKQSKEYDSTLLFPELIDRKQVFLYSRRIKSVEKKLNQQKKHGVDYHNQCYHIQQEKAKLLFINNQLAKSDNYDELQYHGDIKYLLQKLQYYLAKITLQRRYAHKVFNLKPFEVLQGLINLPEYKSNPLIELYLLNIELVENEKESTFLKLLKLLKEKEDLIPEDFLKPIYTNLTNHCTYQLAKGDLNYFNYLFDIYKNMHKANLLVKNNNIDIIILKNIILVACRVNEFVWATDQLLYYIKYVSKDVKNSVFEYNKGIIAFNQGKYEEAMNHFIRVKKIDDAHDLDLRIVQLQNYYELDLNYQTSTQQMINSLKTYIHQNKILTKRQKTANLNFIYSFNTLYKLKDVIDKRSKLANIKKVVPKLSYNLSQFNSIKEKQWLLCKIKTLIDM